MQVVSECVEGAVIMDLCERGDKLILDETKSIYKKEKNMKKGSFLSCIVRQVAISIVVHTRLL